MVSIFGQNPHGRPARAPAGPLRWRTGLGGGETAAAAAAATATAAAAADLVEAAAA